MRDAAGDDASPMTEALFVYGTLKRVTGHPMARRLQSQSEYVGQASLQGRLYGLGSYPGLVLCGKAGSKVHGEVVRLSNPERCFPWLDEYEGCSSRYPEPWEFKRVIVPVLLASGMPVEAWVYFYQGPVSPARQIPDGRFHSMDLVSKPAKLVEKAQRRIYRRES